MHIKIREDRSMFYRSPNMDQKEIYEVMLYVKTASGGHFYLLEGDFFPPAAFIDDSDQIVYRASSFPYTAGAFNNNMRLRQEYFWIDVESTEIVKLDSFSQEELAGVLLKSNWLEA